jgi:hypothetical protein
MQHSPVVSAAALMAIIVLTATPGSAQTPAAGPAPQAQAPAPPKPYKPVALTLPTPSKDASLEAFRKQIADIADRKDRAALAKLVVAQGFFWDGDNGDNIDKKKSPVDNLATAIGLDSKDGSGWEVLGEFAADPTVSPAPDRKDVVCSPADPAFNESELEAVAKSTQTDPGEWGYPMSAGIEVRESALPNAKVTEKLGLHFVRVLPDDSPLTAVASFLRIVTPAGKIGFVPADSIAPLGNDQVCYLKDASGWKIAGYIGSGAQE